MTADTLGGVWTYALELADAVAGAGVETVLATMGRPLTPSQWDEVRASAVAEVRESDFPLEWMDDPWTGVDAAGEWLLAIEDELRPDVIHLNGYVHGSLPWRAPAIVVGHSCVLSWWEAVKRQPAPPEWATYAQRVKAGLAATGPVIAPTEAMLEALGRHYGVAGGAVIPNARHPRLLEPHAPKAPLVLSAGRVWDDAKNIRALVAAAPSLDWPVAIAGEGDVQVADPAAGTRSRGTNRHVNALGPLPFPELAGWLRRAAVFCLPARYEPFGLAAMEAGLAGCALVLGDIPSLREVWGDAAIFVDPFDDDHLRAELQRLTGDAERVADLGRRARDRARTYTPSRTAAAYLTAWEAA